MPERKICAPFKFTENQLTMKAKRMMSLFEQRIYAQSERIKRKPHIIKEATNPVTFKVVRLNAKQLMASCLQEI